MDLSIPEMKVEMRESLPADLPLVFISSVTQEGIQELKDILWVTLQEENKNLQRPELLNENIEIED
jgi:GTP-binding protein